MLVCERPVDRGAVFSPDGIYRYALWRVWDPALPRLNVIGLNASTADQRVDDPTVRRCIGFARAWGFGGLVMTNVCAYRSTDPRMLLTVVDPIGPDNDDHLKTQAAAAGLVLAAWSAHPLAIALGPGVAAMLAPVPLRCLGRTRGGAPRHPLYVPKGRAHEPYQP